MTKGFLVDANSCIGCRTCVVACMDANRRELGLGFRKVKTFATGSFPNPAMYHVSYVPNEAQVSPKTGKAHNCAYCTSITELGEQQPCVAACPMRAIEFGDLDELKANREASKVTSAFPAISQVGPIRSDQLYLIKGCMTDADFDEVLM